MTGTRFTPGLWEIFKRPSDGTLTILVRNPTGLHKHIAYLSWADSEGGEDDARLIAAAPDLYSALLELASAVATTAMPHEAIQFLAPHVKNAKAAIDKAKDAQPSPSSDHSGLEGER